MSDACKKLDAVLFDFGGVLTDPEPIKEELHRYEAQLDLPEGAIVMTLGAGPVWEAVSTGAISEDEYWGQVSAEFVSALPPAFGRFRHGSLPYEELNPDMLGLVRMLRGQTKIGLLSNATISLAGYLRRLPAVSELFDDIVISAEVGLRKPDPAIYQLAAQRLSAGIGRCVLVDDKARNTLAAQAAGMLAIIYESPAKLRQELRGLGLDV